MSDAGKKEVRSPTAAAAGGKDADKEGNKVAPLPLKGITPGSNGSATGATAAGAAPSNAPSNAPPSPSKAAVNKSSSSSPPPPTLTPEEEAAQAAATEAQRKAQELKAALDDIPHQTMVKSRMMDVKGRNAQLLSTVSSLSDELKRHDRDSSDVLQYLEGEVRRKDLAAKKLVREIKELHAKQMEEKATKNKEYAAEIARLESTFSHAEEQLLHLNKLRHQELNDLLLFQRIRPDLNEELHQTKTVILKNSQRHALQMADLEKKFLAARDRLLEESAARIAESRAKYKEEVGRELDLESNWIQVENTKMEAELSFHDTLISKLQSSNTELRMIAEDLEHQVMELERKDESYATNSLKNAKLIKDLQTKHDSIQAALSKMRRETEEVASSNHSTSSSSSSNALTSSLLPLQNELTKLHSLSQLKARENEAMSHQLHLFRSSQTEVELVGLEALARVKKEIVARRDRQFQEELKAYQRKLIELTQGLYQPRGLKTLLPGSSSTASSTASLSSSSSAFPPRSDPRLSPPTPPVLDLKKIRLDDFTLHDRERVLHIIFEKLNASNQPQPQPQQQHHSRASSALSLYSGGRDASSTSLVLSRPGSSALARASSLPHSRPMSSAGVKPGSASGLRPRSSQQRMGASNTSPTPPLLPPVQPTDIRPSELVQMSAFGEHTQPLSRRKRQADKQRRAAAAGATDEKELSFFPSRGDTPSELL